jgi:hypothetical protein
MAQTDVRQDGAHYNRLAIEWKLLICIWELGPDLRKLLFKKRRPDNIGPFDAPDGCFRR